MKRVMTLAALFVAALTMAGCQTGSTGTYSPQPGIETTTSTTAGAGGSGLRALAARIAREEGVPVALAQAVITVESRWNVRARGRAGEIGLMQIKPRTARGMGYRGSAAALYDPETNLRWGMRYLAEAHRRAGGDLCGTILRYNAGHYARRMNPVSARYCGRVRQIMGRA
ncbi:MAG: transglycosylase SLT domain-containing protein [Hyphomicrobiaceae bacterium]|nr:transglycosylase SLT domain-containing protein [Hyphomicrobiaceae bacterium]